MLNSFYDGFLFCTYLSSKQDPKTVNSPMVRRSCLFRSSDRMQTYNQTLTKPPKQYSWNRRYRVYSPLKCNYCLVCHCIILATSIQGSKHWFNWKQSFPKNLLVHVPHMQLRGHCREKKSKSRSGNNKPFGRIHVCIKLGHIWSLEDGERLFKSSYLNVLRMKTSKRVKTCSRMAINRAGYKKACLRSVRHHPLGIPSPAEPELISKHPEKNES